MAPKSGQLTEYFSDAAGADAATPKYFRRKVKFL
jgi:hypothetical protein